MRPKGHLESRGMGDYLEDMPETADRFLRHPTPLARRAALGRVFNVTRETWLLTDDPKTVAPKALQLVGGHTASEAADLARTFAQSYARHGFHKLSASWWGANETHFHRFVVHAGRRPGRSATVLVASGVLGLLAATAVRRRGRKVEARPG